MRSSSMTTPVTRTCIAPTYPRRVSRDRASASRVSSSRRAAWAPGSARWSRYLPKEFYPVDGRPGIAHLLDEIAALGPAEVVIVCHPYYEAFTAGRATALSPEGHDSYHHAARLRDASRQPGSPSRRPPARPVRRHHLGTNGADHLAAGATCTSPSPTTSTAGITRCSPCARRRPATRPSSPALPARAGSQPGVIAASRRQTASFSCTTSPKSPVRRAARALEQRYGTGNLLVLEGRARLTAGFIRFARRYRAPAGTEPKLALAIAAYARTHPVIVATTTSQVIDLGASPPDPPPRTVACRPLCAPSWRYASSVSSSFPTCAPPR